MEKRTLKIALAALAVIFIYVNRDFFNPIKLPLDADAGSKGDTPNVADAENATGDNKDVISRAMMKLKTGSVYVREGKGVKP